VPRASKVKGAVQQLVVCLRRNADREAALESLDAGNFPSVEQLALEPRILGNREVPNEIENEAVARVILGQAVGLIEVKGIQSIFEAGSIIQRFAPRIRSLELQPVRKALLKHRLQRIVVGLGDGILGKDPDDRRRARAARSGQRLAEWRGILP